MEDCNFVVGQVFPDVKAFRNAIKEAAIAQHFELRIIKKNDESWTWFLSELHKALEVNIECRPEILFLSDGQKGIVDAISRKFPKSSHAFCMRHLSESISKEFKNSRLIHLLWKAAYATTTTAFKEKMAEIEEASPEAAKWLQQFHPSQWALVYFEGTRYGHLSSNIEEFNKWILDARELPIIQVIERIHGNLITQFDDRRLKSSSWYSVLTPSAERRMVEAINHASTYQVLRSDEVEFEVISADRSNIVNIGSRSCSCRDWQLYGIPCSHAVAALISCRKDVYAYTAKCFTVASYRDTYAEELHPVPRKLEWRRTDESALDNDITVVRPPKFRRPPGRPENKRICVEDHNRDKHTVHCSRSRLLAFRFTLCNFRRLFSDTNYPFHSSFYPSWVLLLLSSSRHGLYIYSGRCVLFVTFTFKSGSNFFQLTLSVALENGGCLQLTINYVEMVLIDDDKVCCNLPVNEIEMNLI
ncbi:MuDR family transposase [Trifolium repens]|nr:MuDR family transposase [Trifolium repens]